jgi:hypothetical protein
MPYSSIKYKLLIKIKAFALIIFVISLFLSTNNAFPHHQFLQALVADFNNQKELDIARNKFRPLKDSVYSFVDEDAKETENGRCIKLKYDFSGQGNAECGIWLNLRDIKLLPDQIFLTIFARGDLADGFSKTVKVKLMADKIESTYVVMGIRDNWQQFAIPLSDFKQIDDFSKLTDLYIIFDNSVVTSGKGTVYIDEVAFIN